MAQDATTMRLPATGRVLTTADGVPLKTSLRRAQRRRKINGLLLVAPLFLFILLTFLLPIADMLLRSVDNSIVPEQMPRTVASLATWDGEELPDESVFKALYEDVRAGAEAKTINRVGKRLNYEQAGMSSLFRKTARKSRTAQS